MKKIWLAVVSLTYVILYRVIIAVYLVLYYQIYPPPKKNKGKKKRIRLFIEHNGRIFQVTTRTG